MRNQIQELQRFHWLWIVILSLTGGAPVLAQNIPEPEVVTLQATDGFPLKMSYYAALEDKNPNGLENAPVVLFLHGEKGKRIEWDKGSAPKGTPPVPGFLNTQGFAVLTLDLRKHGESIVEGKPADTVKPTDYPAMVAGDLVAVKRFLYEKHMAKKLNMSKMAIVACDVTVPVALAFAEADWKQVPFDDNAVAANRTPRGQDVRALVMISPKIKAGQLAAPGSLRYLSSPALNISMMFIVGEQDKVSLKDANSLHQIAAAPPKSAERVQLISLPSKDAGIPLLVRAPKSIGEMVKFLDEKVAKLDIPWIDRRSRLER